MDHIIAFFLLLKAMQGNVLYSCVVLLKLLCMMGVFFFSVAQYYKLKAYDHMIFQYPAHFILFIYFNIIRFLSIRVK